MSDDLERDLREMLHARAIAVADTAVPADLEPRVHRARTRRNVAYGSVVAAALAVAIGATAVLIERDGDRDGVRLQPPTSLAPTPPAPEPTTPTVSPDASSVPTVAALLDGRIVELDADGTVGRELVADAAARGEELIHIERGPDGAVWYLAVDDASTCGTLMRLLPGDSQPRDVMDDITGFSVAPNGELVVGTRLNCTEPDRPPEYRVVFTNSAGNERNRFGTDESGDTTNPRQFAWSPDGRFVAATLCNEGCSVAVLDPNRVNPLLDGPALPGDAAAWIDGTLWVYTAGHAGSVDEGAPAQAATMQRFDPITNTTETVPNPIDGVIWQMDAVDGSLYLVAAPSSAFKERILYRWDLRSPPVKVLDGVIEVAAPRAIAGTHPNIVIVPDVLGLGAATARAALHQAGLTVNLDPGAQEQEVVYAQYPAYGSQAMRGSAVHLLLCRSGEPCPPTER